MGYDVLTIQSLRKEKNPTDELLTLWGHHNHTIAELFVLLSRMQHYQSMIPLLSFVDQKFHRLLHNGEANLQNMRKQLVNKNTKDLKIGTQNFNQRVLPQQSVNKILTHPTVQLGISPSNSNNLLVASPAAAAVFSPSPQNTGNEKKINESPLPKTETTLPHASYSELAIATDGWNQHNILGKGGFGIVYRGILSN